MDRVRLGRQLRAVRLRRQLRQLDLARAARVSRQLVSDAECGCRVSLDRLERVAVALGAELDLGLRWRGGELDRMLSRRHAALGEQVVAWLARLPDWRAHAEVSFAFGGERGIVDVLAWHEPTRHVAVIELKTGIYDLDEHLGTLDRKRRLAGRIARQLGLEARLVSAWLIVSDSRTNRRRIAEHRALVVSKLPADGRALRPWLRHPDRALCGVAFWTDAGTGGISQEIAGPRRVRQPAPAREAEQPLGRDRMLTVARRLAAAARAGGTG